MTTLTFDVADHGTRVVHVTRVLNAGFAGADQSSVLAHIDELAELGVPRPTSVPTLYNLAPISTSQADEVWVHGDRTSGEAEWALIVDDSNDLLLTVASDHTDRQLETHRIDWGKQIAPDVLARAAWRLSDIDPASNSIRLRSWGSKGGSEDVLLQEGTLDQLLPPAYWIETLTDAGLLVPGTVVLGGTLPMIDPEAQYADTWTVELEDRDKGRALRLSYAIHILPTLEPSTMRVG
ncbi:DUF2848 family protein [Rhodococcus sp. B10]|uniref:DUF2848 family protein n=1 Tax=Rhodococcus sp. B10 TaxID=2695876 RepID=UPI0014303041|nr:DUF2848 family protein [Rhodococcus sp. B10]NIL77871.1 hypothetical protein [Rhodococcus sp. B10]